MSQDQVAVRPDKGMTIFVNVTDEFRKAIEWNCNDGQPLSDEQIGEYLCNVLRQHQASLIHGRHGYRESKTNHKE